MRALLCLLVALGLAGCGTTSGPKDAAQAVYVAKSAFLGALEVADQYAALPRCPQPTGLCADQQLVNRAYFAGLTAQQALDAAQALATVPSSGHKLADALAAAQVAVQAMVTVTQTMRVK